MKTAGLTDAEIAIEVCRSFGLEERAGDFLRAYGELLPERLHRRRGEVLPNVRANLEALHARDDAVNLLLTGNIRAGAEAKLRHYGLWEFFADTGGAFSVEGSDRPSIARAARALAGDAYDPGSTYVIGDTPHDISCGKVIGARTVAVATGPSYTVEELAACEPCLVLEQLPEPEEFLPLLGLVGGVT
jgi:phosphoglycolate phosphatase-like HAD superfamily hydrolase